jgi:hypothetical protein
MSVRLFTHTILGIQDRVQNLLGDQAALTRIEPPCGQAGFEGVVEVVQIRAQRIALAVLTVGEQHIVVAVAQPRYLPITVHPQEVARVLVDVEQVLVRVVVRHRVHSVFSGRGGHAA